MFSFCGLVVVVVFFYVYYFLWLVGFCVFGALAFFVLFESLFWVFGVSGVVGAVFALDDVHVVGHWVGQLDCCLLYAILGI